MIQATTIHPTDALYPKLLKLMPAAEMPTAIYAAGNLDALLHPTPIAVIGTRQPTPESRKRAFDCARAIAEKGIPVVSGLALGCDTEAHRGALAAKGITIAILGHLDKIYPYENTHLAQQILDNNGVLLSEHPLGATRYWNRDKYIQAVIARDRIQAGMSAATILVQSALNGGSRHACNSAVRYGRTVAPFTPPAGCDPFAYAENARHLASPKSFHLGKPEDALRLINRLRANPPKRTVALANI
jgi:DNA processing protein